MPFRVIIAGDRKWDCYPLASRVLDGLVDRHGDIVLVRGNESGPGAAFDRVAGEIESIPVEVYSASEFQGEAGIERRNQRMIDRGADLAIVCHRFLPNSKHTADLVRRCLAANIPVWLFDAEEAKPRRVTTPPLRNLEAAR